jgi:inhibitor of KinA
MYSLTQLGDHAIIIEWPQQMNTHIHQQVMGVFDYLQSLALPEIWDMVPAYASLTIVYQPGKDIRGLLDKAMEQLTVAIPVTPRLLEIPVCYDPSVAPDIHSMASHKGLSIEEIITLHTQQRYTVYMLGFLPGFPYMGKVDEQLATPRLKRPRLKVPAGSVGIAGYQTGIYSLASPGGWNIIGQTPIRMFDPHHATPCFCKPGDQVQFVSISIAELHKMS